MYETSVSMRQQRGALVALLAQMLGRRGCRLEAWSLSIQKALEPSGIRPTVTNGVRLAWTRLDERIVDARVDEHGTVDPSLVEQRADEAVPCLERRDVRKCVASPDCRERDRRQQCAEEGIEDERLAAERDLQRECVAPSGRERLRGGARVVGKPRRGRDHTLPRLLVDTALAGEHVGDGGDRDSGRLGDFEDRRPSVLRLLHDTAAY